MKLDLAPGPWYTASLEVSTSSLMQCTSVSLPRVMTKEDLCGQVRGSSRKLAVSPYTLRIFCEVGTVVRACNPTTCKIQSGDLGFKLGLLVR